MFSEIGWGVSPTPDELPVLQALIQGKRAGQSGHPVAERGWIGRRALGKRGGDDVRDLGELGPADGLVS
jgi:hypothetical protein